MRSIFVLFVLAVFAIGCGESGPPSVTGSCNKANNLCKDMQGAQEMDCAAAQAQYDASSDEEKAQMDKVNQCIIASNDCMAASMCFVTAFEDAFEDMGEDLGEAFTGDENAEDGD